MRRTKTSLLLIGIGYLLGVVAALIVRSKRPIQTIDDLTDEMVDLHRDLWGKIQEIEIPAELKSELESLKNTLNDEYTKLEREVEATYTQLKSQGVEKRSEIEAQVQDLIARRWEHIETLQSRMRDLTEQARSQGNDLFYRLQDTVIDTLDAMKSEFDHQLKKIERKFR